MELIKIDTDHYVVVNDEPIKEGDSILMNGCIIRQCDYVDGYMIIDTTQGKHHASVCKRITDSTQPIERPDGVPMFLYLNVKELSMQDIKSLVGEVDVEKKAEEYADFSNDYVPLTFGYKFNTNTKRDYLAGYAQAIEDNKEKRYTEEDLKYMFECGRNYQNNAEITFKVSFEYLLQTKTSWQVEIVDGKLKLK